DTGGSGLDKIYYTTDGSTPTTTSSVYDSEHKPQLTTNGQTIKYFSTDKAGNEEAPHSAIAHIDTASPATTDNVDANWHASALSVTLTATDSGGSGVQTTAYKIYTGTATPSKADGGWQTYESSGKPTLANGQSIAYYSTDNAGNEEAVQHSSVAKVD